MVPCGLVGHRHCIVSNGSHTFHLRVLNLFFLYILFLDFIFYFFLEFLKSILVFYCYFTGFCL